MAGQGRAAAGCAVLCGCGGVEAEVFLRHDELVQHPGWAAGVFGDGEQLEVLLGHGALVPQGRRRCLAPPGYETWYDFTSERTDCCIHQTSPIPKE